MTVSDLESAPRNPHSAFPAWFHRATGHCPYRYQTRLATEGDIPSLLHVPTGLGKTAAAILAWLWRRQNAPAQTPRRLVYCLPMRVLVEQTRDNVRTWLFRLALAASAENTDERRSVEAALAKLEARRQNAVNQLENNESWNGRGTLAAATSDEARSDLLWLAQHSPVVLMGGEDADEWDLYPERDAILIGTQDMLLSRALNRGYGMSRYRWPMHFGLLHTDCLWVFDEVQLMGSGLATTAQLEAFRWSLGQKGYASMWMSATLQRDWLETVDFDPSGLSIVDLKDDLSDEPTDDPSDEKVRAEVRRRWEARKPLQQARTDDPEGLAGEIVNAHRRTGGRTLIVVNTVAGACELHQQLQRATQGAAQETVLIHSRFRPNDRRRQLDRLLADPGEHGMIVVSTQVVEAGVDVSATTLFTELAPWSSLVQRFGRCNRGGTDNEKAQVFWIDLLHDGKQHINLSTPYQSDDLSDSWQLLQSCQDVGPASLAQVDAALRFQHGQVIRKKDFIELFDTTPDLAGNDIDIQSYVREVEDCDVHVFWREWLAEQSPPEDMDGPRREEVCAVPVSKFRQFVKDGQRRKLAYRWDFLDEGWLPVDVSRIYPGQLYLLHADAGGYSPEFGWDVKSPDRVRVLPAPQLVRPPEANDADPLSQFAWQSVATHTDWVCSELERILERLSVTEVGALKQAARWHDRGKAHIVFQSAIHDGQDGRRRRPEQWEGCRFLAKAPGNNKETRDPGWWRRYERKHFRHELASALAVLITADDQIPADIRDLVGYLVAAHHGKVRLSIRSLPGEVIPHDANGNAQPECRFARGVWDGDDLPLTDLGSGVIAAAVKLSLEAMELGLSKEGQPSWAERVLRLRDDPQVGPVRLAYLEAIMRAADIRASMRSNPPEANHA